MRNSGWIKDPHAVDASTIAMGGNDILFGNQPGLKDYHKSQIAAGNYSSLLFSAEKKLFNKFLPPFMQRRGTCVGQGTARAIQDSLYSSIVWRNLISRAVFIAVAPIYVGSRVKIGRNRINGDGSIGAWASEYVKVYNANERKQYGPYDLSQYNGDEGYAVGWHDVPEEVLLGASIEVDVYRCQTGMDIVDALYAKLGVAFCGQYTINTPDNNGFARLNKKANHCTELAAVVYTPQGDFYIGNQQSWGENNPPGPDKVRLYTGDMQDIRDSFAFAPVEDYDRELKRYGEAWAFQVKVGAR